MRSRVVAHQGGRSCKKTSITSVLVCVFGVVICQLALLQVARVAHSSGTVRLFRRGMLVGPASSSLSPADESSGECKTENCGTLVQRLCIGTTCPAFCRQIYANIDDPMQQNCISNDCTAKNRCAWPPNEHFADSVLSLLLASQIDACCESKGKGNWQISSNDYWDMFMSKDYSYSLKSKNRRKGVEPQIQDPIGEEEEQVFPFANDDEAEQSRNMPRNGVEYVDKL